MTPFLLVVGFVWLFLMTVVLFGLVRHMGALQVALTTATSAPTVAYNFETEGPYIPSALPELVVGAFEEEGIPLDELVVTFFAAGCGPCIERAEEIVTSQPDLEHTVFLIAGSSRPTAVSQLREIIEGGGARVIVDPHAHDIVKSLDISATPFAFGVVAGEVVAKAYVRDLDDFVHVRQEVVRTADELGPLEPAPAQFDNAQISPQEVTA